MNAIVEPGVRDSLLRYAERRLPRADAEDVVQQALCDAMQSEGQSLSAPEQRRWLMTIVKRRVIDWFRARRLTAPVEESTAMTTPEEAIIARDLLRRIDEDVNSEGRRTLDWMMREHDGESLQSIAEEQRFTATALRQRIHRLRVSLRAHHYAAAFALLLALGIVAARAHHEEIAAEPATSSTVTVGDARGVYRVTSLSIDKASPADRVLFETFRNARVRADGNRIIVEGPAKTMTLNVANRPDDHTIVIHTSQGNESLTMARAATGDLVIRANSARFTGEVHLHRE